MKDERLGIGTGFAKTAISICCQPARISGFLRQTSLHREIGLRQKNGLFIIHGHKLFSFVLSPPCGVTIPIRPSAGSGKKGTGRQRILGNLIGKFINTSKFALRPDKGFQADRKALLVKIDLLVEKDGPHTEHRDLQRSGGFRYWPRHCQEAEIQFWGQLKNPHGIDAKGRMQQAAKRDVSSWEPNRAAPLVTLLNNTGDGPVMPQHVRGAFWCPSCKAARTRVEETTALLSSARRDIRCWQ